MKKICIITSGLLPIPDIKGGAIERRITMLINENERMGNVHLTVLSIADKDMKANCLKNTDVVYFKREPCLIFEFLRGLYWLIYLWNKHFEDRLFNYTRSVERFLMKHGNEFDYIINAACYNHESSLRISNIVGKDRMMLHVCCKTYATPETDRTYGTVWGISDFVTKEFASRSCSDDVKFITLHNAIDLLRFQREVPSGVIDEIKRRYGIMPDDFVILYNGRISPEKGVMQLIEAVLSISDKNVKLLLLGSKFFKTGKTSEYYRNVSRLAQEHSDRIIMTGFIDNDQVINYMRCAHIGVVPSLWEEGFGLTLLEMMAAGLPTIATKSGGMVEIGNDETTVFIEKDKKNIRILLRDAILQLKDDEKQREQMGRKAAERAKCFSAPEYYEGFCKLVK